MATLYTGAFNSVRFPTNGGYIDNANVYDPGSFSQSAWSYGAYQIVTVPQQPPLMDQWVIQSWTVALNLLHCLDNPAQPQRQWGRLGRLIAALIPNAAGLTRSEPFLPWVSPLAQLPSSAIQDVVWDGYTDVAPPALTIVAGQSATYRNSPLIHTYSLPAPLALEPGQNVAMGLFLTPSLAIQTDLCVTNATYTIYYDTQPSPGITGEPWGGSARF